MSKNIFNIKGSIQYYKSRAGFTLLEIAVTTLVIAVLFTVVYIAVKPTNRIGETNNAIRSQDVKAIEKAIKSFLADSFTSSTTISDISADIYYSLGIDGSADGSYTCSQLNDASIVRKDIALELSPYIKTLPIDPDISSGDDTGYYIVRTGNLFDVGYCNWYTGVTEEAPAGAVCGNGVLEGAEVCDYNAWTLDCEGGWPITEYTNTDVGAGIYCNTDCTASFSDLCFG